MLSFIMYILLAHTFRYMVKIQLVSNYHNVSWGSRGASLSTNRRFKLYNFIILIVWLLLHILILWLVLFASIRLYLLLVLGLVVLIWNASRLI